MTQSQRSLSSKKHSVLTLNREYSEQLPLLSSREGRIIMDTDSEIVPAHYALGSVGYIYGNGNTIERSETFSISADSPENHLPNNNVHNASLALSEAKICWLNRIRAINRGRFFLN